MAPTAKATAPPDHSRLTPDGYVRLLKILFLATLERPSVDAAVTRA